MKKIEVQEIKRRTDYLNCTKLTKSEVKKAIDEAIVQIELNMQLIKEKFPYSNAIDNIYPVIENIEWTDGFWTGLLWLAFEHTNDIKYKNLAEKNVESFNNRIVNNIEVDHHDLGFLYSPTCVAAYKITNSDFALDTALLAAKKLTTRYQPLGQFIQAWGPMDSSEHYRFIVDCMLNLPILRFAAKHTKDELYNDIANKHFNTSVENIIRDNASCYHTFYMDSKTGKPLKGATRQGYNDDSSWARGQAWGMYGIALNFPYDKKNDLVKLYKGMSNYFLNNLPKDDVCYWDLIFDEQSGQPKDSSAAAIAACGMIEMDKYLKQDVDREVYQGAVHAIMKSLINNYTISNKEVGNPIITHGVYSWHSKKGVDEGNIWGDYYYLEALTRLYKDWDSYW